MTDLILRFALVMGIFTVVFGVGDLVQTHLFGAARGGSGLASIAIGACLFSVAYLTLLLRAEGRR
jgi:hypothetical protein